MLCSALRQRHQLITCGLWRVCVCVACRQQKRGMRRGGVELWMVPEAGQPASQPASQGVVRVHIAGFGGDVSGQRVRLPYYPTFCLLVLFPASQPRRVVQSHARILRGGGGMRTRCVTHPRAWSSWSCGVSWFTGTARPATDNHPAIDRRYPLPASANFFALWFGGGCLTALLGVEGACGFLVSCLLACLEGGGGQFSILG